MRTTNVADPATDYPARGYAWYVVALLLIALTVSFVDRQILSLMVKPIRADLGISDTQIGLLQGFAFVIFYCLVGIPLGRWADHRHRQRMIIVGIVIWSLATAACGLARNFHELFIARIFVGIGEAALSPAAYSLIADYFRPNERSRAMSIYTLGGPIGAGLALILGGIAVAATNQAGTLLLPIVGAVHGWQAAFFIVGLPGLLVAVLMLSVQEPVRKERAVNLATGTYAFLRSRRRLLSLLCIGFGITSTAVYGLGAWLPTLFIRLHGWTAPEIATTYGVTLLTFGIAGMVAAGQMADRWGKHDKPDVTIRISIVAVMLMIPALPVIGLASPWISIAALCWFNFMVGIPASLAVPALQGVTPNEHRGQVIAIFLLTTNVLGLMLGPVLIAMCTDLVFHDDLAIGKSVTLVITVTMFIALFTLRSAQRAYLRARTLL